MQQKQYISNVRTLTLTYIFILIQMERSIRMSVKKINVQCTHTKMKEKKTSFKWKTDKAIRTVPIKILMFTAAFLKARYTMLISLFRHYER